MEVSGRKGVTITNSSDDADSRAIPSPDEIQKLHKRIAQLEGQNEELSESLFLLRRENEENKDMIETMQNKSKNYFKEIHTLQRTITELKKTKKEDQTLIDELRKECKDSSMMQLRMDKTEEVKEKAEKEQVDWKHTVNRLEKMLEDKTKIIAQFEKDLEQMYQKTLSFEQINNNLRKDQEKLKHKNDDLQTELLAKTEEWNLCLEQYEEACIAIDHYKKKVTHLEDTIKSNNKQNEERIQKLVAERDDLRNRHGEKLALVLFETKKLGDYECLKQSSRVMSIFPLECRVQT